MNFHNSTLAVGMLGGGQLAKMAIEAALKRDIAMILYATPGDNPAVPVATKAIIAQYDDLEAQAAFASAVRCVTLEFENVPLALLKRLEKVVPVRPHWRVLAIAQDRIQEKRFFRRIGVPATATRIVTDSTALGLDWCPTALPLFPQIIKTARLGYDGKGQRLVHTPYEMILAWNEFGKVDCVLETVVDFAFEISVIVARDIFGGIVIYPPIENKHRDGILRVSRYPGLQVTSEIERDAMAMARKIAIEIELVGILAVEMFVTKDGRVLANEIAPRPHNSGHGTIEAAAVSQFDQQVRIALGEKVRDPFPICGWRMENLIGDEILRVDELRSDPSAHVHVYGKEVRPGRKMGHVTWLR